MLIPLINLLNVSRYKLLSLIACICFPMISSVVIAGDQLKGFVESKSEFKWLVDNSLRAVAVIPRSGNVLTGHSNGDVVLRDLRTGDVKTTWQHRGSIALLKVDRSGSKFIAATDEHGVTVRNLYTGQLLRSWSHSQRVTDVAISEDGIASGSASYDQSVKIQSSSIKGLAYDLVKTTLVNALSISPDGEYVLLGTLDGNVELRSTDSREILMSWSHTRMINALAFSPDGKILISAGADNLIKVIERSSRKLIKTIEFDRPVQALEFIVGVDQVIVGSAERVLMKDFKTGTTINEVNVSGWVRSVSVSEGQRTLLVKTDNGTHARSLEQLDFLGGTQASGKSELASLDGRSVTNSTNKSTGSSLSLGASRFDKDMVPYTGPVPGQEIRLVPYTGPIPDHIASKPTSTPTPVVKDPRQAELGRPPLSLTISPTKADANGVVTLSITTNGDTASLKVNGDEEGSSVDGRYSVRRFAQIGETHFEVIATDRFGNTERQQVSVFRNAVASTVKFPPLNPSNVRVRPATNAVAIIIGIQDYRRVPKAEFANNDARLFYDYAMRGLGVKPENIKLLLDQEADDVGILGALQNWLPLKAREGQADVYVFYSGHGLPSEDGASLYLLPAGVDRQFLDRTAIKQSELVSALQAAKPKSVTLFMDACYSGQIRTGETLLASARPILIQSKASTFPSNFTVLSASAPEQIASSSPDLKHGIFSYYLMKGMEGEADQNKDGAITVEEMQSYLEDSVGRKAMALNRAQQPQVIGDQSRVLVGR